MYEPCTLGPDGRCSRWSHSHKPPSLRGLAASWLAETADVRGYRRDDHWRGGDYVDGYEAALERCAEELRDALGEGA